MTASLLLLTAAVALTGPGDALAQAPSSDVCPVEECLVSPRQHARVSAQEDGMVEAFDAQAGMQVTQGEELGKIDARVAEAQYRVAASELDAAKEEAESDVEVRLSHARLNVFRAEMDQGIEANRTVRGTVPQAELRRRKFAVDRSVLEIEQAEMQHRLAKLKLNVRQTELDAAKLAVERRTITAPFGGVIVETFKQAGEWVTAGEPVYRIMELDELWVEGVVDASSYLPSQLVGKPVTVSAEIVRGRKESFAGHIAFVSPEVDLTGVFRVKALVKNRRTGDFWLLRPGLRANMSIDLNGRAVPAQARNQVGGVERVTAN